MTFKATRKKRGFLHTQLCHATPVAAFRTIYAWDPCLLRFTACDSHLSFDRQLAGEEHVFSGSACCPGPLRGVQPPLGRGFPVRSERRWLCLACASESHGCPTCAGGPPASLSVHCSRFITVMLLSQMSF